MCTKSTGSPDLVKSIYRIIGIPVVVSWALDFLLDSMYNSAKNVSKSVFNLVYLEKKNVVVANCDLIESKKLIIFQVHVLLAGCHVNLVIAKYIVIW